MTWITLRNGEVDETDGVTEVFDLTHIEANSDLAELLDYEERREAADAPESVKVLIAERIRAVTQEYTVTVSVRAESREAAERAVHERLRTANEDNPFGAWDYWADIDLSTIITRRF